MQNFSEKNYLEAAIQRLSRRWDDNIKMDVRKLCCEGGRWIELAQGYIQKWALFLVVLKSVG
jgi:hypothetical protein